MQHFGNLTSVNTIFFLNLLKHYLYDIIIKIRTIIFYQKVMQAKAVHSIANSVDHD